MMPCAQDTNGSVVWRLCVRLNRRDTTRRFQPTDADMECGGKQVRERRHRFAFGHRGIYGVRWQASPRATTPLWLRPRGIYGVRWQSESASGDTALPSALGRY